MNAREIQRVTIPSLPNSNETDQKKVNREIINCLQNLYKRDEDKEKRLRKKEEITGIGIVPATRDVIIATADYTVASFYNDKLIVCQSALAFSVYFPSALGSGKFIVVKNYGVGTVTATPRGTDTIENNPSQDVLTNEGIIFWDWAVGRWLVS